MLKVENPSKAFSQLVIVRGEKLQVSVIMWKITRHEGHDLCIFLKMKNFVSHPDNKNVIKLQKDFCCSALGDKRNSCCSSAKSECFLFLCAGGKNHWLA